MTEVKTNTHRTDPYKDFKFRVKFGGRYVAGISKVSALKKSTETITHREGADTGTHKKAGRIKFDAISMERGVTHDPEFELWAGSLQRSASVPGEKTGIRDQRKDITIEGYNEAGQLAIVYHLFGCRVSEFQALPDADANANAVAIQHIKLEHEGWEEIVR